MAAEDWFDPMDEFSSVFRTPDPTPTRMRRGFQAGTGNYKWKRAGGVIIDMHDMDDEYLANCIRLCDEMGNNGKKEQLEAVLKARQSVYIADNRKAEGNPERVGIAIGQSTSWKIPE